MKSETITETFEIDLLYGKVLIQELITHEKKGAIQAIDSVGVIKDMETGGERTYLKIGNKVLFHKALAVIIQVSEKETLYIVDKSNILAVLKTD